MTARDPLTRRLRIIVREEFIGNNELIEFPVHGVQVILNERTNIKNKIFWIIILVLSFLILIYQSYDRVAFFLSHPTETDVFIEEGNSFDIPVMLMCAQETEALLKIPDTASQFKGFLKGLFPLLPRLETPNIDLYYLWNATNVSSLFTDLHYQMPSVRTLVPRNLAFEYQIRGLCVSIYPDEETSARSKLICKTKKLKTQIIQTPLLVGWISEYEPHQGVKCIIHLSGNEYNYHLSLLTYKFLNKSDKPCQSEEDYQICAEKCFEKRYLEEMDCKFPFFPEGIKLPSCKTSPTTADKYYQAEKINQETSPLLHCNCIARCSSRKPSAYTVIYPINVNETKFTISRESPITVQTIERWSYESIALLCDIGGNLGLLTGLSLLGLFDSITLMQDFIRKKRKMKIMRLHPLNRIVRKHLKRLKYSFQSRGDNVENKWFSLHSLTICSLWIISIYLIAKKIEYFNENPKAVSIFIKENATLEFPNAAVCATSVTLIKYYKKYKKKHGTDNICEIDFLDLLDLPNIDAQKLWDYSDISRMQGKDFDIRALGSPPLTVRNKSTILLHKGKCIYFEIGVHNYSKDLTFLYFFPTNPNELCSYFAHQLYLLPPLEDLNVVSSPILIPKGSLNAVTMDIIEVDKSESPDFLCTNDPMETLICKRKCLKDKLREKIPCKLPFIDVELDFCKNASFGKMAYNIYVNVSLTIFKEERPCKCLPRCTEIMYLIRHHSQTFLFPIEGTEVYYFSNFIQVNKIVPKYPFTKLIGDIGGYLGLSMGLSILHVFRYFYDISIGVKKRTYLKEKR